MIDKDTKIFEDKSLSDVFSDIYNNSKHKQVKIDGILDNVKDVLKDVSSASLLLPIIKEVLEISVKNDEQLVKLAGIIQKLLDKKEVSSDPTQLFTLEEKRELLNRAKNENEIDVDEKIEKLSTMVEQAKSTIKNEEKKVIQAINEA